MSNPTTTESAAGPRSLNQLVQPFFRVIVTRRTTDESWDVIINPKWDAVNRAKSNVLINFSNDYAETRNCGVIYRMIRARDWRKYVSGPLDPAWALNPELNNEVTREGAQPRS